MSAAAVITIVIAAVVVLGAIVFVTAAKRSDVRGAGGCRVAFVHPRGAAGVLLELKEEAR